MGRKWRGFKRFMGRQWRGWLGKLVKDSVKLTVEKKLEEELRDEPRVRRQEGRRRDG